MGIDKMEAGREMDLRVAERLKGWCWPADKCPICGWKFSASAEKGCVAGNCSLRPPPQTPACEGYGYYSTDIAASFEVDKPEWEWSFVEDSVGLRILLFHKGGHPSLDINQPLAFVQVKWNEVETKAHAYALGRCRTALKAVEAEHGGKV